MEPTTIKLAVCYPWSVEHVYSRFVETALNLRHPPGVEVRWIRGRGWSSSRRHIHCCEQAVKWGADLICILGADQVYPDEDTLTKLVNRHLSGCPVVTTLVPMRGMIATQEGGPFQSVAWRLKSAAAEKGWTGRIDLEDFEVITREKHGDLVQINAGGTGTLLFPTTALSRLSQPWFYERPKFPSYEREQCADSPFLIRLQAEAGLSIWCDTTIPVRHLHVFEIDETYNNRFADWEHDGGDASICAYRKDDSPQVPVDDDIRQVRVSKSIPFFEDKFRRRYRLRPYHNMFQPTFQLGCYTREDLFAIQSHNGPVVIVWMGTDSEIAAKQKNHPQYAVLFDKKVRHIAISEFIAKDLESMGLSFTRIPVCSTNDELFRPEPITEKGIYVYLPGHSREKYGGSFIDELMKRMPDCRWVINDGITRPQEDMPALYQKCAVGIRPTKHDGLANGVVEMGLMGRNVLWNGDSPNSIPFSSVDEAEELLRDELAIIPTMERIRDRSDEVRRWISVGEDWKKVSYYKSDPTFSIVIPCYNACKTIGRTISSIAAQTRKPIEVIVVDDGSTDDSGVLAARWPGVKVIRQHNQGPAAARNRGIRDASGEYIIPVDADDYLEPTYIEEVCKKIVETDADVVYTSFNVFGEENFVVDAPTSVSAESFSSNNPIGCCSTFRRSMAEKVRFYNPNMVHSWEDYDLWVSMVEQGATFAPVHKVLWNYQNTTTSRNAMSMPCRDELLAQIRKNHPNFVFSDVRSREDKITKEHLPADGAGEDRSAAATDSPAPYCLVEQETA